MARAIVIEAHGGPEALVLREREIAAPEAGQALVRVLFAGVNFIDVYFRTGAYPIRRPFTPGLEGVGVIEAVGEGVQGFGLGDRVAWAQVPGSYATHAVVPVASLVRVPDAIASDVAGAAMLQGMTAHYLAHGVRETKAGDVALVHAAAGGTGLLLVQMLRTAGARVIGTCSTDAKAALAREAGAAEVVRYDSQDFVAEVKRITGGRGVDVAYDSVGRTTFDGSLACLRPRGLCVLFGQASGPVPPFDLQALNRGGSLFVTRPTLAHYVATRAELELRANAVLAGIAAGRLHARIGARFPLAEAAEAHRVLEGRATTGKVLLEVG